MVTFDINLIFCIYILIPRFIFIAKLNNTVPSEQPNHQNTCGWPMMLVVLFSRTVYTAVTHLLHSMLTQLRTIM